jgi:hypothetical protein
MSSAVLLLFLLLGVAPLLFLQFGEPRAVWGSSDPEHSPTALVSSAPERSRQCGDVKKKMSILMPWCKHPNMNQYSVVLLTPKFGKESDQWVQLGQESVSWKGRISQMYSAKKSAVGYLVPFGKGTVELILRDWTMTWLKQGGRMDG